MKAIIISDENKVIEVIDKVLKGFGFETIIYKWLLKALDNIEEIKPDLVIVSAYEYPRHWKTLAQFVKSGIGGKTTKILLLCQTPLPEDERQKAATLGVQGFFTDITEDGISELESILKSSDNDSNEDEIPTVSNIISERNFQPSINLEDSVLLFTNPHSGKIITGKVNSYKNKTVEFIPENPQLVIDINQYDEIEELTFEIETKVQNYTAKVISKADTLFINLVEEIDG